MPNGLVPHRPQTLRQARQAYLRAPARQLSRSELALLERRAVLLARADRIKDREARRKRNLKRKEERREREKEALERTGREGIAACDSKVGPSQLDLAQFLPRVETNRSGTTQSKEAPSEDPAAADGSLSDTTTINSLLPSGPSAASARALKIAQPSLPKSMIVEEFLVSNSQIERELFLSHDEGIDTSAAQRTSPTISCMPRSAEASSSDFDLDFDPALLAISQTHHSSSPPLPPEALLVPLDPRLPKSSQSEQRMTRDKADTRCTIPLTRPTKVPGEEEIPPDSSQYSFNFSSQDLPLLSLALSRGDSIESAVTKASTGTIRANSPPGSLSNPNDPWTFDDGDLDDADMTMFMVRNCG